MRTLEGRRGAACVAALIIAAACAPDVPTAPLSEATPLAATPSALVGDATVVVQHGAMQGWLFYNDETDVWDNSLGSFVTGPSPAPVGTGSAQISVSGTQRRNLTTYQFAGTPFADITTLKYSTYNASATNGGPANRAGYLNINVDFDGSDTWQHRLVFLPSDNGTIHQDTWDEWDAINGGNALWRCSTTYWSGTTVSCNTPRTWDNLVSSYPPLRIRVSDAFFGIRVGEPYDNGYTENIDKVVFGTAAGTTVFDFEPGLPTTPTNVALTITPTLAVFDSNNVVGIAGDAAAGYSAGSFGSDGSGKTDMYFPPSVLFPGRTVALGDIARMSYWTKKGTIHSVDPADWYLTIYTKPYLGQPAGNWYGARIGSEPYFSINISDPANTWNNWTTDGSTNKLRFFESTAGAIGANFGSYTDPDWASFTAGHALPGSSPYGVGSNYAGQDVLYFTVQTGSAWADGFTGQLDGFSIQLTDGSVATINFEPDDTDGPVVSNLAASLNPVAVNGPVSLTANISDLATGSSDIESAEYSIDGGTWTMMDAADGTLDSPDENVEASLGSFSDPAVLSICVRGTDASGNTGDSECTMLAVYDPSAGFVTGGGWIISQPGAYMADPSASGKATFGFVSRYVKGKTTPTGSTEFRFKAGNLEFSSSSYEWLVISGARAQYKGSGTINGGGDYRFMLTAIDGDLNGGGGTDKFRIRIWDNNGGGLVYDNQAGDPDTADPVTAIGGGNIVIHKK